MALRGVPQAVGVGSPLVRLWCGYYNGAGTPLYLDVDVFPAEGDAILRPDIDAISRIDFKETIRLASRYVRWVIGWPENETFEIAFIPIAPDAYPRPGSFEGTSHFGAVTMGLAQAVARSHPQCARSGAQRLLHILDSVCLDRVAVCATFAEDAGDFKPVECIGNKLESFCLPEVPRPAVSVVALNEDLDKRCGRDYGYAPQKDPDFYHPQNSGEALPILRARDPIEAFLRLWDGQAGALVGRL